MGMVSLVKVLRASWRKPPKMLQGKLAEEETKLVRLEGLGSHNNQPPKCC